MPSVTIGSVHDTFPELPRAAVVVAIDVIRSTTTAISCVFSGRRCLVVPTLEEATWVKAGMPEALLIGELGGNMPYGFDLNNSPLGVSELRDPAARPAILLSTSGTRLMTTAAARHDVVLVAALRNWEAQTDELLRERPEQIVLLGAGTRGEFREEDQLCCAWIAGPLLDAGFEADEETRSVVARWRDADVDAIRAGPSARYLLESGQLADLEFVLAHVADVPATFRMHGSEVVARPGPPAA
jgi:2-phosphosulfolactate phosphatase